MYTKQQALLESSIPEHRKLGETMYIPEDHVTWAEYIQQRFLADGTYASLATNFLPGEYNHGDNGPRLHRSITKFIEIQPYSGYLSNKKWHLNEVRF